MDLAKLFYAKAKELEVNWEVCGLLGANDKVYSLTDDTKVLSTVFELLVAPVLKSIADDHGLIFKTSESQTVYPDFTLMRSEEDREKIAIDVKTTYRRGAYINGSRSGRGNAGDPRPFSFTLGSYASYLRNNTKNIQYPYDTYAKDYIIGFLYSRNRGAEEGQIKDFEERNTINKPFIDVDYFVQEKYKISGDKPGSGNTENIGSFSTNKMEDFKEGRGPFSKLEKEVFENYWKNYGGYRNARAYTSLEEYQKWKINNGN
ncbi:hypothetical protein A3F55_00105 [Candidatus Adlerbacteria bacterium RIFCSPHIGHO2_12_FULL_53_18]|uniref:Restriction endonuclease n=1 Tax=Candidatus Adlerbacteria bacterium RIFCSPHIGHO2_12_FULL_53_18 TaxID=1797242 RepID=A0A1F4XT35_9BACT|nr:MAG: hypothetical protein A3F55_00105 [Candidatus Adlerbacteria bacterium RIFCSPHIGHO2_12_FULL_53_18]